VRICPACGRENPEGFLYCGFCTASLTAAAAERRKLVTLVFCDVAGSTALGEQLDAEAVRGLMLSYFAEAREVLEGHGGTVEKFIGDAVVGAFGVPVVHEDDALRACRAALEIRARVSSRMPLRIGVNTGEVIAGNPAADRDTFVSGDAVNVAARLEQAASPGEVLIGDETYRLVRDAVAAEAVEPIAAKGKSEPVAAYRLVGVSGIGPLPRRPGTPLAGRDRELALLEREFDSVVAERRTRLVTVVGEPGVGKSRLAAELVSLVGSRARVVRGTCLSYGEGITYWAIGQIVRALAGVRDEHSRDEALARIAACVAGTPNGGPVAANIAQVLGLAGGSANAAETAWAIRHFLAAQAGEQPLVVVVDDIHWAEAALLDVLEGLPAATDGGPILVVCLARLELLENRPGWDVAVRLEPLDGGAVNAILDSLLGTAPHAVRERLAIASAGNPLFVEELAAMLLDEGVLRIEDGVCVVEGDLDAVTLPTSLRVLLGARLDRLHAEARATLERGAIEGEVFHQGAVVEMTEPALRSLVPSSLETLSGKDFVRPAAASFVGEAAFRFKHILVRDAAYRSTPKRLRAALHEGFADWLERLAGERVTEYEEILGYHLRQSYRYRVELGVVDDETCALGDRAACRLGAAGQRAHARGDARAASTLFATAAELASDPLERAGHALRHGTAAREAGAFGVAADVLARVRQDALAAGWRGIEAAANVELAWVSGYTDPMESTIRMREAGERALAMFEALGDDRGAAGALVLLARERWMGLHCGDMEDLLERALPRAEHFGDQRLVAVVLIALAQAVLFGPRPAVEAGSRCETLLERARAIGPTAAARISMMLAVLEASLGHSARARALQAESRAVVEELAAPEVAIAAQYAGLAALIAGEPERAEQELRSAEVLLEQIGERTVASTVAALRARALVELGRDEDAERAAMRALGWADADDVISQVYARGALARSFAARDDADAALENAHRAVELASESDSLNQRGDAHFDLALVLGVTGDLEGAWRAAADALELYRAKGNVVSGERARRLTRRA
jgi:class 3 adenylate cyclase/tetratricopeptide (TPR) repeat protein